MTIPGTGFVVSVPTSVAPADVARILLGSTVQIDALRGRPAAKRLRALRRQGDEPWTCAISIEEIWRGLLPGEEAAARRLVRGLRCAPLGPAEGIRAGGWRRQLAGRGTTVHQADCLIAAATAGIEARLATGNPADFPMDDITVERWPIGR
jgi:predicted nucleic acid-binding protein